MSTEMTKLEGVKKSCHTAAKVVKVFRIIATIAMIMAFVGSIIIFSMHSTIDTQMAKGVAEGTTTVDNVKIELNMALVQWDTDLSSWIDEGQYARAFGVTTLIAGIAALFGVIILKILGNMLNVIIESESPFSDEVLKKLKKGFIVTTVFVGLASGLGAALFFGLFFWCIYTVFQYGHELQKQADETL